MKRILPLILLGAILLLVYGEFLKPGLPYTHDSQNHIARMAQFYLALKEGQFPPRWAPQLNNGFGYPVFNFNYPLANMVAFPLIAADFSMETGFKIISFGAVFLSALGMYFLLARRYGARAAVLGAILYSVNPYQANLIYVRGSIGETLAFSLLPWVALMFDFQSSKFWWRRVGLALLASLFWLSHNIFVFFSLPVLLVLGFLSVDKGYDYRKRVWPLICALLLVAWFWIPALFEKNLTNLDGVSLSDQYSDHFPTIAQLVSAPFEWGFSYPGPVDGMSFALGFMPLFILGIFLVMDWRRASTRFEKGIFGLLLGYLFLVLPLSQPVWHLLPFGSYIQFPWRLLFLISFLTAVLGGFVFYRVGKLYMWILLMVGWVWFSHRSSMVIDRFSYEDEYWLTYAQTTSIQDENMPKGFDKFKAYELVDSWFADGPIYIEGEGDYAIERWTGSGRKYQIQAGSRVRVFERGASFPGWEVYADGTEMELAESNDNPGLVEFMLEPGSYTVESRLTQQTPARLIGNTLSLLGIIGVGYMAFYDFTNRKK